MILLLHTMFSTVLESLGPKFSRKRSLSADFYSPKKHLGTNAKTAVKVDSGLRYHEDKRSKLGNKHRSQQLLWEEFGQMHILRRSYKVGPKTSYK